MRVTQLQFALKNLSEINNIKNAVRATLQETPKILKDIKDTKQKAVYANFVKVNDWYTKLIGLDKVRQSQERVVTLQDQLFNTQEKRREISKQLTDVRGKCSELQDNMHKVKREDNFQKFIDLRVQETELLKMIQQLTTNFNEYDQAEREIFTALTNAIRDSHEQQRSQLEYTKYFGLILSITGSFLMFIYSTLRKEDIKRYLDKKLNSSPALAGLEEVLKANEETLKSVVNEQQNLQKIVQSELSSILVASNQRYNDDNKDVVLVNQTGSSEYFTTRNVIIGGVALLILSKVFGD